MEVAREVSHSLSFPGKVPAGGQFPNLEPAQTLGRQTNPAPFQPVTTGADQSQHCPQPGKGALAGRGTVTFNFCSSPQLVGGVIRRFFHLFPRVHKPQSLPLWLLPCSIPGISPKTPPVLPHPPPCAPRITQTSRVRLSPPHQFFPLGADSTGTSPGSTCSSSIAP